MGGAGARVDACAREIYGEWAACQHFELYDDVPAVLRQLADAGVRIGLISNSHRCLASFQSHFELQGLISATVSSSEHGCMKPHPSIFSAALQLLDVAAADAVMVGDSLRRTSKARSTPACAPCCSIAATPQRRRSLGWSIRRSGASRSDRVARAIR